MFLIEFDVDIIFICVLVYVVFYLGKNDVYEFIYVLFEFYIYLEDLIDIFIIESILVFGYLFGEYDILLEFYDVDIEMFVVYIDVYDDSVFVYFFFESENNEYVVEDMVVIVEEYGGVWFLFLLCLLGGIVFVRCRIKWNI